MQATKILAHTYVIQFLDSQAVCTRLSFHPPPHTERLGERPHLTTDTNGACSTNISHISGLLLEVLYGKGGGAKKV